MVITLSSPLMRRTLRAWPVGHLGEVQDDHLRAGLIDRFCEQLRQHRLNIKGFLRNAVPVAAGSSLRTSSARVWSAHAISTVIWSARSWRPHRRSLSLLSLPGPPQKGKNPPLGIHDLDTGLFPAESRTIEDERFHGIENWVNANRRRRPDSFSRPFMGMRDLVRRRDPGDALC